MEIKSNRKKILRELDRRMKAACEVIGGIAESAAKDLAPVDTGLLRNSITHGMAGGKLSVSEYTDDAGGQSGRYTGQSVPAEQNQYTVVIGTNVHYAPYQELGAPNAHIPPAPFLRPAVEGNADAFKAALKQALEN